MLRAYPKRCVLRPGTRSRIATGGTCMEMENSGAKAIWFLAGAAIGAAVALLYAPATGADTRDALARKTSEGRDSLADTGREMIERGRELYEKGRQIAEDAADLF